MAEMTIKRFGVWSVAKINAVLWFIFGLIIGVIYGLFFILFGAAMSSLAPERDAAAMGGISSGSSLSAVETLVPVTAFRSRIPERRTGSNSYLANSSNHLDRCPAT